MFGILIRRGMAGCLVVLGVTTLTFLLLRLAPGDPALRLLGPTATPAQVAALHHAMGFDDPVPTQYARWLGSMARGDWGESIATGRRVRDMLADAWPATFGLVLVSLILSYGLGLLVGSVQTARAGSRLDTILSVTSVTLFAVPGYWLALMLVAVFTYEARLLPAFGAAGLDADLLRPLGRVLDTIRHAILPLATLTLIGAGGAARFVRGTMFDVARLPFVTTARAKGLRESRILRHHVLRNALIPIFTLLGLSVPTLFSGAVFVEAVFAWPGVGRVLVEAVQARDYPVVMGATMVSAVLVVIGNVLADVIASAVDPRIRHRAGRA